MTTLTQSLPRQLGWIIAALAGILLFGAFTVWGGIPTDDRAGLFWIQMVVLLLLICAFVLLFWHLLIRPLAPNLRKPVADTLSAELRRRIALVLAGGNMALFIGAFWDELWHRNYGIPFGEDFFWRPHLLMYFGFATSIFAGFWALYYLNRHLKGNFQQRFRSNSIIGLLTINALFMLYALTADPFWHWTFGQDLSAWSVPHLILLASITLSSLVAVFTYGSTLRLEKWRTIARLNVKDAVPLLLLTAILMLWLQVMLIDWDQTLLGIKIEWLGLYRPEWLLAANLLAGATLIGIISTRVLRCAGAATAVGLLTLAIRFGLLQAFDTDLMHYVAWIAVLPPLIAIDLWSTYCSVVRKGEPEWRGTAFAVVAAMALNLVVIRSLYNLDSTDNLAYGLAVIATGIGASWLGHQIADAMLRRLPNVAGVPGVSTAAKPVAYIGIFGGFLAFIVLFILTASPPV